MTVTAENIQAGSSRRDTQSKTLVLCFDGTLDRYNDKISNIARLVSFLEKNDPDRQLVYYQAGVGTSIGPAYFGRAVQYVVDLWDSAFATSLDRHVRASNSWAPNDNDNNGYGDNTLTRTSISPGYGWL